MKDLKLESVEDKNLTEAIALWKSKRIEKQYNSVTTIFYPLN